MFRDPERHGVRPVTPSLEGYREIAARGTGMSRTSGVIASAG